MFTVVTIFIFAGVLGATMRDGLWSNTLRFFNVLFAALVASTLSEPVAGGLRGMVESRSFFFNFLALWLIFWLVCGLLQVSTNKISRVKVKFDPKVNLYGGYAMAFLLAFLFLSFSMYTMHQAPLGKQFLFKGFQSNSRMFFGTAPDRQWYTFYSYVGGGSMGSGVKTKSFDDYRREYDNFRSAIDYCVETTETTAINPGTFK